MLFYFVVGHFLADYPLQNDYLARSKNHKAPEGNGVWYMTLPAHGFIHGGFVAVITGSVILGLAETILHSLIDYFKCDGKLSYQADQFLHLVYKVVWAFIAVEFAQRGIPLP